MNRIQELRMRLGLNMKEAAAKLGLPYTTYVNYEKGTREPNSETLIQLADFYETTIDYLIGKEPSPAPSSIPPGFEPMPEMVEVPLIGHIACGEPITAEENLEGRVGVPTQWGTDFALLCKGDSMLPTYQDGDVVCIHKQPTVENGQVAAVRIDCEATLKRVYLYPDRIVLQPENPSFSPIVKVKEEMNEVNIEGKVVGLCRRI